MLFIMLEFVVGCFYSPRPVNSGVRCFPLGKIGELIMTTLKPDSIKDIVFELRDIEIFRIPDTKTRIATVQNYFFPRLEILLRHTLALIQEIYEVNPYERMTFVYCPSNRKSARENADFDWVHIGLSGKRRTDRELTIKRRWPAPVLSTTR